MKYLVLIFTLILASCGSSSSEKKEYKLTYVVYYTHVHLDTVTVKSNSELFFSSDRGTNSIRSRERYFYKGSAPYKVISYTHRTLK